MKQFFQLLLTTMLLCPIATEAQTTKKIEAKAPKHNHNEAGIELGGTGLLYNLYYQQHLFSLGKSATLNLRVGGAAMPLFLVTEGDPKIGYNVNLMPTLLFFKKRHAWETGIAVNLFDYTIRDAEYTINGVPTKRKEVDRLLTLAPQVSYRYYFKESPFYLRGTILMNIGLKRWNNNGPYDFGPPYAIPWAGISAGLTL